MSLSEIKQKIVEVKGRISQIEAKRIENAEKITGYENKLSRLEQRERELGRRLSKAAAALASGEMSEQEYLDLRRSVDEIYSEREQTADLLEIFQKADQHTLELNNAHSRLEQLKRLYFDAVADDLAKQVVEQSREHLTDIFSICQSAKSGLEVGINLDAFGRKLFNVMFEREPGAEMLKNMHKSLLQKHELIG